MKLELKINSENAAFSEYPELETSRILHNTADRIANGVGSGVLMDINGNKVGDWYMAEDDDN